MMYYSHASLWESWGRKLFLFRTPLVLIWFFSWFVCLFFVSAGLFFWFFSFSLSPPEFQFGSSASPGSPSGSSASVGSCPLYLRSRFSH